MASLIENMAPEYTTDGAKAGNYYMHSKLLYLCKSDCSGLFDESNFEQVYLSDLLRGTANSNLGGKPKILYSLNSYSYPGSILYDIQSDSIFTFNVNTNVNTEFFNGVINGSGMFSFTAIKSFECIIINKQYNNGNYIKENKKFNIGDTFSQKYDGTLSLLVY